MQRPEAFPAADLWAITCFFNPVGYRRRLQNYKVFRSRLNVPLVAVELSYDSAFDLDSGDAEILIQLRGQDVMWQKERLLNIALRAVPPACQKVAWIDCDVLFENPEWSAETSRLLDLYSLVQPYQEMYDLRRDAKGADRRQADAPRHSMAFQLAAGCSVEEVVRFTPEMAKSRGQALAGLTCAFRRELFERRGLYHGTVLGGDDRGMMCAALGRLDVATSIRYMNAHQRQHFLEWAEPFHDDVRGQVGCAPGAVFHQWHGDLRDRRYTQRYQDFTPFDFDPYADVALDECGVGCWSSDKPGMHRYVRSYFAARNEDGLPAPASVYAHV